MTITGTNFVNVTSVTFDGAAATVLPGGTETTLTVTSPAHAIGTVDVRVVAAGGTSPTDGTGNDYRYFGIPTVTAVAPARGPIAGNRTVVLTGTNLLGTTAVTFGTAPATFTVDSDTQLTVTTPAGAVGTVDVTVTTPGGTSSPSGTGNDYRYFDIPAVTSLSTGVGPIAGGTTLTISGTNLDGVTKVSFGTTDVTAFTTVSDTAIVLTTPAHAIATVDVVDRKSTRLNSSHIPLSRMPSSA